MTTAQSSIHGHDVIALIRNSPAPLTREDLRSQVHSLWGAHARFHTCSAEGMTLDELLAFLLARGKLTESPTLSFDASKLCNHGDHGH